MLVASIKNFIDDEDWEGLNDDDESEADEEVDKLTYAEEREIHKKSPKLIDQLMETLALDNFKSDIQKLIDRFSTNQ